MDDLEQQIKSWSTFYSLQKKGRKKFGSIWRIPLSKKLMHVIAPLLHDGMSVLDVGAHDRKLESKITALNSTIHYKSLDIDPFGNHDYRSFDEIKEKFDIAILSEVIEHLTFPEGVHLLQQIESVLKPGGAIVVSTPNMKHPHRYWTSPDHITPYNFDALAGILMMAGFELENMHRIHNQPFFPFYFRRWIGSWLHWYLDIDFALSIVAVGRASKKT
ncbi:MAG: class I SAM-dependent methyltransferase [Candidatus Omnitrophica bacterium]|nr:class I SAM-dependent methyltransferase [Candidatus Omnitrophota bacterium]